MKTVEIKKKLIEEINSSTNMDLLKEFYHFLNLENEIQETYKLGDEQRSVISEARDQIKNGNLLNNEDANKEIEKILN